jgi:hypothetical protein
MPLAVELKDLRKSFGKTEIIRGADLATAITALRDAPGRDVNVMGSSRLVTKTMQRSSRKANTAPACASSPSAAGR